MTFRHEEFPITQYFLFIVNFNDFNLPIVHGHKSSQTSPSPGDLIKHFPDARKKQ